MELRVIGITGGRSCSASAAMGITKYAPCRARCSGGSSPARCRWPGRHAQDPRGTPNEHEPEPEAGQPECHRGPRWTASCRRGRRAAVPTTRPSAPQEQAHGHRAPEEGGGDRQLIGHHRQHRLGPCAGRGSRRRELLQDRHELHGQGRRPGRARRGNPPAPRHLRSRASCRGAWRPGRPASRTTRWNVPSAMPSSTGTSRVTRRIRSESASAHP